MSDQNPQGAPASTAPATTPATPVTPVQPVTPAVAADDPNNPKWLPGRLAQAERQAQERMLADLGVSDVAAAKAAIAEAKKAAEANQTAEQRAANAAAEAQQQKAEADRLRAVTAEHAGRMMMVLSAEQQKAVKDIAGDDPAAQLRTIGALTPTWSAEAAKTQAAAAAAATAQTTTVAPVTTGPGATAPAGAAPGSPPDHRAVYLGLRATNPWFAALYGATYPSVHETKP